MILPRRVRYDNDINLHQVVFPARTDSRGTDSRGSEHVRGDLEGAQIILQKCASSICIHCSLTHTLIYIDLRHNDRCTRPHRWKVSRACDLEMGIYSPHPQGGRSQESEGQSSEEIHLNRDCRRGDRTVARCISKSAECFSKTIYLLTRHAARYNASQLGAKINAVQKEIGLLKKVGRAEIPKTYYLWLTRRFYQAKKDADHLLKQKTDLERKKKQAEDDAVEKEKLRDRKCKMIGNYVHESVPVNDNEVCRSRKIEEHQAHINNRTSTRLSRNGHPKTSPKRNATASPTTKS